MVIPEESRGRGCVCGGIGKGTGGNLLRSHLFPLPQKSLTLSLFLLFLQPTNFTNPVYATLYMGAHNSRNSLASTDEKRELLSRGADDDLGNPLA